MSYLIEDSPNIQSDFPFDPTYGYTPETMLKIEAPQPPDDFEAFWKSNYAEFQNTFNLISITDTGQTFKGLKVKQVHFQIHHKYITGAWLLEPELATNALVMGHGYGGRDSFNISFILPNTAILLPCALGFHLSKHQDLPNQAAEHVIYHIEDKNKYIIKYNVMELWASAKILQDLYAPKNIFYDGGSFGGGLGALALPWESLFKKAQLEVPTFSNQPLRINFTCTGSGQSVKNYYEKNPSVLKNSLLYFDASIAARFAQIPALFTLAAFDPAVPPPGQFSVHNAWAGKKKAVFLHSGHYSTKISGKEEKALLKEKHSFFT